MKHPDVSQNILIVDDVDETIDILKSILENEYRIKAATNGKTALDIAGSKDQPDIILLDVMMPDMDGIEVCRLLKENPATKEIPVIFITALEDAADESNGFDAGGVDYITKPVSPAVVRARVKTHLALHDMYRTLEEKVRERTGELNDTRLEIIRRLSRAGEYRDNETGMHVIRMSKSCQCIAIEIGLTYDESYLILNAVPMHDIGKIGIPDTILLKPSKLTDKEYMIMKTHCLIGCKIIGGHCSELLRAATTAALSHHEKWDGSGYPYGTIGTNIPLIGRIAAIADVFDAITSKRPYKKAWPTEQAVEYIHENSGHHFDPDLVEAFMKRLPEIIHVREQYGDE